MLTSAEFLSVTGAPFSALQDSATSMPPLRAGVCLREIAETIDIEIGCYCVYLIKHLP